LLRHPVARAIPRRSLCQIFRIFSPGVLPGEPRIRAERKAKKTGGDSSNTAVIMVVSVRRENDGSSQRPARQPKLPNNTDPEGFLSLCCDILPDAVRPPSFRLRREAVAVPVAGGRRVWRPSRPGGLPATKRASRYAPASAAFGVTATPRPCGTYHLFHMPMKYPGPPDPSGRAAGPQTIRYCENTRQSVRRPHNAAGDHCPAIADRVFKP